MMPFTKTICGLAAAAMMTASAFAADFGPAPSDYEDSAIDYISTRLEDPRGARYDFDGGPYQVYVDLGSYEGLAGWAVDVRVKARMTNGSFGGYVPYTVIFVDGDPVAFEEDAVELTRL